jgi:hypothetical protein
MPVTEVIRKRISIRSYENKALDCNMKNNLKVYLENLKGPFKEKTRYRLVENDSAKTADIKLGTYGVIKGVSSYVVSAASKGEFYLEQLGYELEDFILYATSLGLGTCWLGGTFKKGEFAKAIELKEDEILPIVTPVGYPGNNKSLVGALVRTLAGSNNRKTWAELFFEGDFQKSLTEAAAGGYKEALEMVRIAPSASNKQPWRIVKDKDAFHFYLAHNKGYSDKLGFDMQRIDIGIAMCHFEVTLREAGINGRWEKVNPNIKTLNEDTEYIVSFIL